MSGPSMLEPHGTDLYDSDPAWMHWKRCGLCGDPVDPDASTKLAGFDDDVFHIAPCAASYCREHDEFDCGEASHADR